MRIWFTFVLLSLVLVANGQIATARPTSFRAPFRSTTLPQQTINSISSNEASMMLLMRYIHAAEATYMATTGAGRYGTLQQLYLARFIDVKVRTGVNAGYRFVLTVSNPAGAPSTFEIIARPVSYLDTGVRTFALSEMGTLRESYRQNALPAEMNDVNDECGSVVCTEAHARAALRTIHSAEATFQATAGAGRYGTLEELEQNYLISGALASGILNGYSIRIHIDNGSKTEVPSFEAFATPLRFPRTGNVSFYMDETGVLRGGYKNGFDADAGDDPFCG